ncbi:hypothetical protein PIB30_042723 [Stylosanthes scabra]|uniref:Uncharacterized protein n=1 Tax=Stylosanthes scabra TaxID=79078 RepID=A0ABU6ZE34_9FABA|nr:hypothetical protein [Stylosanthes scabra]
MHALTLKAKISPKLLTSHSIDLITTRHYSRTKPTQDSRGEEKNGSKIGRIGIEANEELRSIFKKQEDLWREVFLFGIERLNEKLNPLEGQIKFYEEQAREAAAVSQIKLSSSLETLLDLDYCIWNFIV